MTHMKTQAPEKKSVKTLKGQLFGAISMMLVAAIALGTSTYAWFINNRAVTVEDMQLTVSASSSMLVALEKYDTTVKAGKGDYTGYKSVIVNDDITGTTGTAADQAGWTQFLVNDMVPASITDASLITASPAFYATNNHVANGLLDEFELVPAADSEAAGVWTYGLGQGPVKKLGLRFVSSNDLEVFFGKDDVVKSIADLITPKHIKSQAEIAAITDNDTKTAAQAVFDAETKQAEAIRAALRVAVVAQTTGLAADGTTPLADDANNPYKDSVEYHTFQFDAGDALVVTNKNNTDYNGKNNSITINEKDGVYAAIATVTDKKVNTVDKLTALVPGHGTANTNADNTLAEIKDGEVTYPKTNGIKLFSLTKDVARDVDVYIWLEGTDQDCLNGISGYTFNLKLPFVGADKPEAVTPAP